MEGLLAFLMFMGIAFSWHLRKEERRNQFFERHEVISRKRKVSSYLDQLSKRLYRAGIPLKREYVGYVYLMFIVSIVLILMSKFKTGGLLFGLILAPLMFNFIISILEERNERKFLRAFLLALDIGDSVMRTPGGKIGDFIDVTLELLQSGRLYDELFRVKRRADQVSMIQAFEEMAERVNMEYVNYFVLGLKITTAEGGDVAKVFDDIRRMMNRSVTSEEKLKAKTSGLRKMAWIIILIPLSLGLLFWESILSLVASSTVYLFIVIFTVLLNLIGAVAILKVVKLRV